MTSPARTTSIDPGLDSSVKRSKAKDEGTLDLFGGVTHVVEVRAHLRTVPGPPPPNGVERKETALAAMTEKEAVRVALDYIRGKLVDEYKSRVRWMHVSKHFVTSDDADRLLRQWPQYPRELVDRPNQWRGSLFKSRGWVLSGHNVPSTREHMNATTLPGWKWEGA